MYIYAHIVIHSYTMKVKIMSVGEWCGDSQVMQSEVPFIFSLFLF